MKSQDELFQRRRVVYDYGARYHTAMGSWFNVWSNQEFGAEVDLAAQQAWALGSEYDGALCALVDDLSPAEALEIIEELKRTERLRVLLYDEMNLLLRTRCRFFERFPQTAKLPTI